MICAAEARLCRWIVIRMICVLQEVLSWSIKKSTLASDWAWAACAFRFWTRTTQMSIDYETLKKEIDILQAGGFNYYDTAYIYHGELAEGALGDCLVDRYPRDSFLLSTKNAHQVYEVRRGYGAHLPGAAAPLPCGLLRFLSDPQHRQGDL